MQFKIDTKDSYTLITLSENVLNVKLAEILTQECINIRQNGRANIIIDLSSVSTIETDAIDQMLVMHEESYSNDDSLVFTGIHPSLLAGFKEKEADMILNIAPRLIEAIDIVNMEILERDIMNEED